MTIGENIRNLRRGAGLSQEELAEIANVTNKAVSSWEIGGRTPRLGALRRIAEHFGVSVADILSAEEIPQKAEPAPPPTASAPEPRAPWRDAPTLTTSFFKAQNVRQQLPQATIDKLTQAYAAADAPTRELVCRALGIQSLPIYTSEEQSVDLIVYDSPASAGLPLYVESGYERIAFLRADLPYGTDFGVRISGDSMEPMLRNGAIVFVHKQETIAPGQVGIFTVDGDAVCKRFSQPHPGARPMLVSENPKYAPIDAANPDVRVVGVVTGSIGFH